MGMYHEWTLSKTLQYYSTTEEKNSPNLKTDREFGTKYAGHRHFPKVGWRPEGNQRTQRLGKFRLNCVPILAH